MLKRATAVLATAVTTLLVAGVVQATPPDPNNGATKPIREQNLDGNGWIRVHEQGVAKVDVQNANLNVTLQNEEMDVNVTNDTVPIGGTVDVGNFPSNQDVTVTNLPDTQNVAITGGTLSLPPVTKIISRHVVAEAGESATIHFPVINATNVYVQDVREEMLVELLSPLTEEKVFGYMDFEDDDEEAHQSFLYPIPVNGIKLFCSNDLEDCSAFVDIAGF